MTVQQGMDSARIREISGRLDAEVTRLGELLGRGSASAGVLEDSWSGDDGQHLLVRWRSEAMKQIGSASEMLRSASRDLQRQADQQDDTSGQPRGGPSGPGGGGPGGPGGPSGPSGPGGDDSPAPGGPTLGGTWDPTERDDESVGIRTNRDEDGNLHHYDPVTGKTWVEAEDGSWELERGRFGHETRTDVDETDHGDGHTSTRESSRGEGGGSRSWGSTWENEWTDEGYEKPDRTILDEIQTEPLVEQDLWSAQADANVAQGAFGDEGLGGSGQLLAAQAGTEGTAGLSLQDGAYIEANAQAGAYLARGEMHWENAYGTAAQGEAYLGAEAEAEGRASIGPGGVEIDAGIEAFAGGMAEAGIAQEIGDYGSVGVGGEVSYGIGGHADIDAELSADRVGFSVDVGATLGVGFGVNFDVSVSPSEIIGDIGSGFSDVGGAIADSDLNPLNWGW